MKPFQVAFQVAVRHFEHRPKWQLVHRIVDHDQAVVEVRFLKEALREIRRLERALKRLQAPVK